MKQAQPEDEVHGLVQLPLLGEIRVKDIDRLTYEEFTRTVTCPQCGTTQGLTLRADGDTAVVICPQDQRAFDEPHIHAMEVRLLSARPLPQGTLEVPTTPRGAPWLDTTPVLDEDRTLAPFRFLDEEVRHA